MSEIRPLPVHPRPFPTENLLAYVLRLFSANGCSIPAAFQQLSSLSPAAFSDRMIDRKQLSAVSLHPVSAFDQIAVKRDRGNYEMSGQQISSRKVMNSWCR